MVLTVMQVVNGDDGISGGGGLWGASMTMSLES